LSYGSLASATYQIIQPDAEKYGGALPRKRQWARRLIQTLGFLMKPLQLLTISLGIFYWFSHSYGSEPTSSTDLMDLAKPSPPIPKVEGMKFYKVYPKTRENCEGWVRLSYANTSDITNGILEVLDSKPTGKYDGEAINALIDVLSYQRPKFNSGLVTVVDESGHKKNIFTYSVGCENVEVIDMKPNK